jgi:DNA-directed RNA polymerase specialized sigma24 family protein
MEADSAAEFAVFYQASRDGCLRAVLASVGDGQLAEDLVAEGFVRALMAWRKVRQHPAPDAWVVRTALNTRISWWRRHRREVPLAGHDVPAPPGPEPVMDAALLVELRRLPLRQREVIALRVFLDLDTQATAAALGIAPGTVGAHLSQAVAALRGQMSNRIRDDEEAAR